MKQNEKIMYIIIAAVVLVVISAFFRPTVSAPSRPVFEFTQETALKNYVSDNECMIEASAKLTNQGDSVENVVVRAEVRDMNKKAIGIDLISVGELEKNQFKFVDFKITANLNCDSVLGVHLEINSFE